ncbi:hypothetical protein BD779DRAFT_1436906 [Infundibulicybe gibba]|nr:hypothetical protein BD779DRAFT_1436906 [Infundibulicybe gibba]
MAFAISDYLVTDDLTVLLGLIGATVFLLNNLYKPQPLVHPILLGRQSDVARVRNPGESAIYRNYGTGLMGRFPARPNKDVHILADLVKGESEAPRTLWNTKITNSHLQDRVAALGTGLLRLAGLKPQKSDALLLLNDSLEFILSDLALAAHSIKSHTLSALNLLSPFLESHNPSAIITQAELLPQILELIYDHGGETSYTIIVVGEPSSQALASVASRVKVLKFSEVEREGVRVEKIISPLPNPGDVFTVSSFASSDGSLQQVQFTHEHLTAGVAATRALLPLSHALSPLDTIVSAHPLSTAYGRAIAYTAIFEGTSFATVDSSKLFYVDEHLAPLDTSDLDTLKSYPIPPPTILFLKPGHVHSLAKKIVTHASKSFLLYPVALRHKTSGTTEGFITKESLWDRLVFDGARAKVIGETAGTLRALVISGPIDASALTDSRIALSVPLVNAYTHPMVPGPVLASHPLDLQDFSENRSELAHVGPPSVNIEAKLVNVNDESIEQGNDPVGNLLIRGPSVGTLIAGKSVVLEDEWVQTEQPVRVQTNGSFLLVK